ncbi:hypothetical protein M0813_21605 [Anaeramoeba flamelloides]|uniref:Uncharacterized protein n=1 Tax=Anaeramoeba flamelloides TaxID=1746091 RepID=A0ABQ8YGU5_9EUKA|nr:hypothetical protein M0813_21605 [Anaeramoeba flamelloides]
MTRSSKNDLQIDEDISLPFDINHLTNVCEKARLEYTNKLVVVESSESDEIMCSSRIPQWGFKPRFKCNCDLRCNFPKHPKYKGDMTSDYFRVYDKNICEGKTVVPLAPTVVYLKDKPLLNDLPILCRDFFNATSWEINSTKYYYNYSQEVHLIIDRAPSEYLFISCSDLDFRFDSLLDWSLGGNRYWLQSLVLFQGNHYTSLVRIISTWYHFNDIGRSTYKGKKLKPLKILTIF